MAAGRKLAAAAVALVAAVLLLAAPAAEADAQTMCGVTWGTVSTCKSYCDRGNKAQDDCCRPLKGADLNCLCNKLQSMPKYSDCANKLNSDCNINHSCRGARV